MFFLLRCIFWLSIVFAHVSWPNESAPFANPSAMMDAASKAALHQGVAMAENQCRGTLDTCLETMIATGSAYGNLALREASKPAQASVDTLTEHDRRPRWQAAAAKGKV